MNPAEAQKSSQSRKPTMSQDDVTPNLTPAVASDASADAVSSPSGSNDSTTSNTSNTSSNTSSDGYVPPTPARCWRGAAISGGLTVALYGLNQSIIHVLQGVPLPNKSVAAANIAVAVRTLVIGLSTLATAIFAIATLGLLALGIQLLIKQRTQVNQ
jgi:hypothetical protein